MQNEKYIAITGAAGGIGTEIIDQFILKGYNAIGIDIDAKGLRFLEEKHGASFHPIICDVSKKKNIQKACEDIYRKCGVPNIWFNNAGITNIGSFGEISEADFDRTLDVNFRSLLYATRYWITKMEDHVEGGTIVNMASAAGHLPSPGLSAYVSSKFAVVGLTRSLQMELEIKKSPVKLVLVSPGFVETDMVNLGKEKGLPAELSFLATDPKKCVSLIIESILNGETDIWPTLSGNTLQKLQRISPKLTKFFTKSIISRALHLDK